MRSSATRLFFVCLATLAAISVTAATVTGIVPAAAPHGARVLVTGWGLDAPDLSVTFSDASGNAIPASIVSSFLPKQRRTRCRLGSRSAALDARRVLPIGRSGLLPRPAGR